MKKINLLPSFSITQQKEIAQWHKYTVIVLCLLFMSAAGFQMTHVMRAYALQKDIAALRKKVQPYEPLFTAFAQTKQDISHLQQKITEFKKVAQQTAVRIDVVSKIIMQGISISSLAMHDNEIELALLLPQSANGEQVLEKVRSLAGLSSLQLMSVQHNTKSEMSLILQGKIA